MHSIFDLMSNIYTNKTNKPNFIILFNISAHVLTSDQAILTLLI